jgi:hypothetical protein
MTSLALELSCLNTIVLWNKEIVHVCTYTQLVKAEVVERIILQVLTATNATRRNALMTLNRVVAALFPVHANAAKVAAEAAKLTAKDQNESVKRKRKVMFVGGDIEQL